MLANPNVPKVQDAEARNDEDRVLILDRIEQSGGFIKFDHEISTIVLFEIARLRICTFAKDGDVNKMGEELQRRPVLVDTLNPFGRSETLLMIASRYGHLEMVHMLLRRGANASLTTPLGWTALHYAAICLQSNTKDASIKALLEHQCDANVKNCFGRTPLGECVFNACSFTLVYDETRTLLVPVNDGRASIILRWQKMIGMQADVLDIIMNSTYGPNEQQFMQRLLYMQIPLASLSLTSQEFYPLPLDTYYFSHWVARLNHHLRIRPPVDGMVSIYHDYVEPTNFGVDDGERFPSGGRDNELIMGLMRAACYIKYKWPSWEFHLLCMDYCSVCYLLDLEKAELKRMGNRGTTQWYAEKMKGHDPLEFHQDTGIQLLYP